MHVHAGDVSRMLAATGRVDTVIILRKGSDAELTGAINNEHQGRQAIETDKRYSMKVMRESDYFEKQSQQTASSLKFMGLLVAILFSLAAMIGAAITMNGAVAHRTREIGTLRALGFSRRSLLTVFRGLVTASRGTSFPVDERM